MAANDEIGVLLPVRLETRVDQDAAAQWQLRLRVVPDEASVVRHRGNVSAAEWEELGGLWNAFDGSSAGATPQADWLDSPSGATAWVEFATAVGPQRACWIVSRYPPTFDAAGKPILTPPADLGQPDLPNRISGFPKTLNVWAVFQGQAPILLKSQTVQPDALLLQLPPDPLRPNPASPDELIGDEEWWSSWSKAKDIGLGIECPLQGTPETLEALYVIGLGEQSPAEHFRARGDAGEMAVLAAGMPTNTIQGRPAASLDLDGETWRQVASRRLRGAHVSANAEIGAALTGKADALPALPGEDNEDPALGQSLVRALWSALWGHSLRDIWGFTKNAELAGDWAGRFLYPEGPLPPIRLTDQPYGLLPVTSLARWKPNPADPRHDAVEESLCGLLVTLRGVWAGAARTAGNVVGASTQRLLEMLARDGLSGHYGSRRFLESTLFELAYGVQPGLDTPGFRAQLDKWVRQKAFAATPSVGSAPAHFFVGYGHVQPLRIPLVKPTRKLNLTMAALVQRMSTVANGITTFFLEILRELPDSLLIRLMIWACWHNRAAMALEADPALAGLLQSGQLIEPPVMRDRTVVVGGMPQTFVAQISEIDRLVMNMPNPQGNSPARVIFDMMRTGFKAIIAAFDAPVQDFTRLERVFRATLDSALYRLDPWAVGVAWHRLEQLQNDPATHYRLGVYGWVDGPILGKPGPTDGGLLHSPSQAQAVTAVILRDKFLDEQQQGSAKNPWAMALDSKTIREADALADEVRVGAHLWEAVGRLVERVVATTAGVTKLRQQFPIQSGRPDPHVVCQGMDALAALRADPVGIVPLDADQQDQLTAIAAALDAYGDLLVCEAVYQVVHGKGDSAGATMDAAAGLHRPPNLDFVRTPRQGRSIQTSVLCAFPQRDPPAQLDAWTSPGLLADPSVAAALLDVFGDSVQWTWVTLDAAASVTLADLGLTPIDSLALPPDSLTALAQGALAPNADGKLLTGTGAEKHRQARELIQAIGRHPCLWRDLAPEAQLNAAVSDTAARDGQIRAEFLQRYDRLKTTAGLLRNALQTATTTAQQRQALRSVLCWGIQPQFPDVQPVALLRALFAPSPSPDDLAQLPPAVDAADAALATRLLAAPPIAQLANAGQLATAIAELASAGGALAVLSVMERAALETRTTLRPGVIGEIEGDWLTVVAAVRAPMARFEAWQLEGAALMKFVPLLARTNHDDPWMRDLLQANDNKPITDVRFPRFVAAYGTASAWQAATTTLAVGLIDAWSDTVPARAHTTTAAFGFNAPAARAPQAILIAAPPVVGHPLDDATLRDIVIETRELVHARAAVLEQLGHFQALTPLATLPGTGSTGVRLTP